MQFLVKLIEVNETKNQAARKDLYANCTHVAKDYWLYEGDEEALDKGIDFTVAGEKVIEEYGDLSSREIKNMVQDIYNVDRCFLD